MSSGLLTSDEGVIVVGTGRVGSRPTGYDRGSARLILEREDIDDALEGAALLLRVDDEKVDAIERRDRHDELEAEVALELAVLVDMKEEAVELRPEVHEHGTAEKDRLARLTRLECLRKHALDVLRRVPSE